MNSISDIQRDISNIITDFTNEIQKVDKDSFIEAIKTSIGRELKSVYLADGKDGLPSQAPTTVETSPLSYMHPLKKSGEPIINTVSQIVKHGDYDEIVKDMSTKYDVPFNLIKKVIQTESSFNPNAVSSSGAQGLMQLMPKTAEWLNVKNSFDPKQNIEGGTKYLKQMLDRYDGNVKLALAAYNAGPGNVDKYSGVPPFQETQRYIQKILG